MDIALSWGLLKDYGVMILDDFSAGNKDFVNPNNNSAKVSIIP